MIRAMWEFLSDLRLTFWTLLACVLLFVIGSIYTGNNYSYFDIMNEMTIQSWLLTLGLRDPALVWWLPFLFAALFLLALNTFCCSLKRIAQIWPHRTKTPFGSFMLKLSPSLVHILFLMVMGGHLLTVTLGSWDRYPLNQGESVMLSRPAMSVTVNNIEHRHYSDESLLRKRIKHTTASLTSESGAVIVLSFLKPASFNGYHFHLDMIKKKRTDLLTEQQLLNTQAAGTDDETCNKAHVYHAPKTDESQQLYLLVIADPGLGLIMAAFAGIVSLMSWYFFMVSRGTIRFSERRRSMMRRIDATTFFQKELFRSIKGCLQAQSNPSGSEQSPLQLRK
jgi:hypothetical protein